jgi:hypothetical protein
LATTTNARLEENARWCRDTAPRHLEVLIFIERKGGRVV